MTKEEKLNYFIEKLAELCEGWKEDDAAAAICFNMLLFTSLEDEKDEEEFDKIIEKLKQEDEPVFRKFIPLWENARDMFCGSEA